MNETLTAFSRTSMVILASASLLAAAALDPVTADSLPPGPSWTAQGDKAEAAFGAAVATAGDVNGDGYDDVIVGAPGYVIGPESEGLAFVFHGSDAGLPNRVSWWVQSDQAAAQFGATVAAAGDVNGDGYDDVIVGALDYSNGQAFEGRAYVYHGSANGLETTPAWTAEGEREGAAFGCAVSTAGDVDGDGYVDVIVGARLFSNSGTGEGRVFIYRGSATGLEARPSWTIDGDQNYAFFGAAAATAGDVNGDGYADLIVGAQFYANVHTSAGRAYVYHGSASGPADTPAWTAEGDQGYESFGFSVSTAGDVNDDGYADVIVGAVGYYNTELEEGRASVYLGSATGLAPDASWTDEGSLQFAQFGFSAAAAGDVNGDGYADVIVGAPNFSNGEEYEGRTQLYHGAGSGLAKPPEWTAESDQQNSGFGMSVATAGDVNADGFSDVIVGAPDYDQGQTDEGRAFVFLGSGSGAVSAAGVASALILDVAPPDQVTLAWSESCLATDTDYAIYAGTLGDFSAHAPLFCSVDGATTKTFTPEYGDRYYLVVPLNATREGSYGTTSAGFERPSGAPVCKPRLVGDCD